MKLPDDLKNYDRASQTLPIWEGNTVFHESIWPVSSDPSSPLRVKLVFPASEIISLRSSDLGTLYEEGKDYLLSQGDLLLLPGGSIHITPSEVYNPADVSPNAFSERGFLHRKGGYLFFTERDDIHRMQYSVSYKKAEGAFLPHPLPHAEKLPLIKSRLAQGKDFRICYWGDSITTGANASSLYNIAPYTEMWPVMVTNRLHDVFSSKLEYVNKAVGGTASKWGADEYDNAFKGLAPDLLVVAFGMNDGSGKCPVADYIANIESIMKKALAQNKDCEFILISTSLPNPDAVQFEGPHLEYEKPLGDLADSFGASAVMLPFTSFHAEILRRKEFRDMTGNNINHPNDFLTRLYSQIILNEFSDIAK